MFSLGARSSFLLPFAKVNTIYSAYFGVHVGCTIILERAAGDVSPYRERYALKLV